MITAKRKSSQKGLLKPFDSEPNIARGNQLFSIGEQKRRFCEAVNCERSEREGKFLFALLWLYFVVSISITAYSIIMDVALVIETAE